MAKFVVRDPKMTHAVVEVASHNTEAGGTGRSLLHFPVTGKDPFRTVEIPDALESMIAGRDLSRMSKLG
jgi:hypothetical protein